MSEPNIESILQEKRTFLPSPVFSQNAQIASMEDYQQLYDRSCADPAAFWAELAEKELHWFKKWEKVLDWQPPVAQWFSSPIGRFPPQLQDIRTLQLTKLSSQDNVEG